MRALTIFLLLAVTPLVAQEPQAEPSFGETIFVVRYALDVRVVDSRGQAIDVPDWL